MKNKLSTDLMNIATKLESIKKKHNLVTDPDEMPTNIDKALRNLKAAYIDAIIDEEIHDSERVLKSDKRHKRKTQAVRGGD